MQNYHHKPIKRFGMSGTIHDEATIGRLRNEYVRLIEIDMNENGYAVRLDIDPDFTIMYNEKNECFEFELSVYGIYVGKNKTQWITGIDITKTIPSHKNKSKEFS